MKCPKCSQEAETIYKHPDGEMCFACCADANLGKFQKMVGELFQSFPVKPLQDMANAETIKAYTAGAALIMTPKPATQMSMYQELAPHYEYQFLTATKGAVDVFIQEGVCKKAPKRLMLVGFKDRKLNTFIRHAIFSCS